MDNHNTYNDKFKTCTKCKSELLLTFDNWHKDKNGKNGFRSVCKSCRNRESENYRKDNPEKNREKNNRYFKNYSEANKDEIKLKKKLYRNKNKEEIKRYSKIWRSQNVEYLNKRSRDHYRNNKETIRKKRNESYNKNIDEMRIKGRIRTQRYLAIKSGLENTLTNEQWRETLSYFNEECSYCGIERELLIETTGIDLNQEHVIPLSKGGGYTKENIIPACRSCNSSKNNKDYLSWYNNQMFYSKKRSKKILAFINK